MTPCQTRTCVLACGVCGLTFYSFLQRLLIMVTVVRLHCNDKYYFITWPPQYSYYHMVCCASVSFVHPLRITYVPHTCIPLPCHIPYVMRPEIICMLLKLYAHWVSFLISYAPLLYISPPYNLCVLYHNFSALNFAYHNV